MPLRRDVYYTSDIPDILETCVTDSLVSLVRKDSFSRFKITDQFKDLGADAPKTFGKFYYNPESEGYEPFFKFLETETSEENLLCLAEVEKIQDAYHKGAFEDVTEWFKEAYCTFIDIKSKKMVNLGSQDVPPVKHLYDAICNNKVYILGKRPVDPVVRAAAPRTITRHEDEKGDVPDGEARVSSSGSKKKKHTPLKNGDDQQEKLVFAEAPVLSSEPFPVSKSEGGKKKKGGERNKSGTKHKDGKGDDPDGEATLEAPGAPKTKDKPGEICYTSDFFNTLVDDEENVALILIRMMKQDTFNRFKFTPECKTLLGERPAVFGPFYYDEPESASYKAFLRFCEKEVNSESLLCLTEVKDIEKAYLKGDFEDATKLFQKTYLKYFRSKSKVQVNLPSAFYVKLDMFYASVCAEGMYVLGERPDDEAPVKASGAGKKKRDKKKDKGKEQVELADAESPVLSSEPSLTSEPGKAASGKPKKEGKTKKLVRTGNEVPDEEEPADASSGKPKKDKPKKHTHTEK